MDEELGLAGERYGDSIQVVVSGRELDDALRCEQSTAALIYNNVD